MVSIGQTRERISTIDWSFAGRVEFWTEALWLGALALVPLVFSFNSSLASFDEAKSYALHFFALALFALLVWDYSHRFAIAKQRDADAASIDVVEWLKADRANWLLAAVGVFTFVYIVSTALSPMPFFSLWGVTPASSGYNLYSFLSMMVIFLAIVTHVRSMDQVRRILYLIAGIGVITSVYGVAQHFGWDPIGVTDSSSRVVSSFGNPIHFGAYLVMSIPATAMFLGDRRVRGSRRLHALVIAALGLQLAAMWFTGSRGPLVGLIAAGMVSFAAMALLLPRRQVVGMSASVAAPLVVAAILIFLPSDAASARAVQFGGELSELANRNTGGTIKGGLGGRGEIWADVLELSVSWETLPPETGVAAALKPLFGLGPDMLRFSTPLVAGPRSRLEIVDHAHNRFLQVLAEQGWVGLISFTVVVGLAALLIVIAGLRLRGLKKNPGADTRQLLIFIAISGALIGAGVEQMSGVGRVSDLLTSWVLIGLLVVVYRSVTAPQQIADTGVTESAGSQSSRKARRRTGAMAVNGQSGAVVPFALGLTALVVALVTFALVDTQMLRASRMAMDAFEIRDSNAAYQQFVNARSIAPEVEGMNVFPAEQLYDDAKELLALERRREAADLAEEAYIQLLRYHDRNPLSYRTRILLAETAALLLEIGLPEYRDDMVLWYEDLARQFPTEVGVLAVVANAYAAAERYEKAIELADRSIALEPQTRPTPQAWWVRGRALDRLGREDEAIASLETAIERDIESDFAIFSHEALADIYQRSGDTEKAEFHTNAALELEEQRDQPE